MGSFVTTYDGEELHIVDVRATKLQQALETDIYMVFMKTIIKSMQHCLNLLFR